MSLGQVESSRWETCKLKRLSHLTLSRWQVLSFKCYHRSSCKFRYVFFSLGSGLHTCFRHGSGRESDDYRYYSNHQQPVGSSKLLSTNKDPEIVKQVTKPGGGSQNLHSQALVQQLSTRCLTGSAGNQQCTTHNLGKLVRNSLVHRGSILKMSLLSLEPSWEALSTILSQLWAPH